MPTITIQGKTSVSKSIKSVPFAKYLMKPETSDNCFKWKTAKIEYELYESLRFPGLHCTLIQLLVITENALPGNAYCISPSS